MYGAYSSTSQLSVWVRVAIEPRNGRGCVPAGQKSGGGGRPPGVCSSAACFARGFLRFALSSYEYSYLPANHKKVDVPSIAVRCLIGAAVVVGGINTRRHVYARHDDMTLAVFNGP